jgi:hypothetical protein
MWSVKRLDFVNNNQAISITLIETRRMFVRRGKTSDDAERVNGREEGRRYRHERDNREEKLNDFSFYLSRLFTIFRIE